VVAPGDPNSLKKETPTIASGKWHLGDKPDAYPIEHGFDEMKHFGAYYPGVYAYNDCPLRSESDRSAALPRIDAMCQ
jgi:arylsulfatase